MPFRPYSSHPQLSSSHLFSSRLIRSMFGTKHRSSSATSTQSCVQQRKDVCQLKTPCMQCISRPANRPNKPCPRKEKEKIRNPAQTRPLANASKKQTTYSSVRRRRIISLRLSRDWRECWSSKHSNKGNLCNRRPTMSMPWFSLFAISPLFLSNTPEIKCAGWTHQMNAT